MKTSTTTTQNNSNLIPMIDENDMKTSTTTTNNNFPLILIQQSHFDSFSQYSHDTWDIGTGYDIILPSSIALVFWRSFIAAGARPIGLQEYIHNRFERSQLSFPENFVGTQSYKTFASERAQQLQHSHLKHPPAKRPNYTKLGSSQFVFQPDFLQLINNQHNQINTSLLNYGRTELTDNREERFCFVQVDMLRGRCLLHAVIEKCSSQEINAFYEQGVYPEKRVFKKNKLKYKDKHPSLYRLGYVISPFGYSYIRGHGFGIALVQSKLFEKSQPLVAVRNPNSNHFHFALLQPLFYKQ
mmetsp:Transcript_5503/g.8407  ORF Transcript_5503/g.8407 Transcript_5503/m.8407 type:complete len:298 (-) Transcript_5503:13-906(-)